MYEIDYFVLASAWIQLSEYLHHSFHHVDLDTLRSQEQSVLLIVGEHNSSVWFKMKYPCVGVVILYLNFEAVATVVMHLCMDNRNESTDGASR